MSPAEVALHVRRKARQVTDARPSWPCVSPLEGGSVYPRLPRPEDAPAALRQALARDAEDILAGRWRAFGHLDLAVDDPPVWQRDYLGGVDVATERSAFRLDHRQLPRGADIRLIWELSRWQQLVRLAMAAYVLGDAVAALKSVEWLEDWVQRNPPYRGWNWTSALEVGIRLVQFTWLDMLLGRSDIAVERLERMRRSVLPAHVRFAWRYRSFGSSANNHLLGELAGCVVATVRWPALTCVGASLDRLQRCWEREVLAQFAEDGGNREQALHYHLFAFELCTHARGALEAAGRRVALPVVQRLDLAASFFSDVQAASDPWDYGDSDDASVVPVFAAESVLEWRAWMADAGTSSAVDYWLGGSRRASATSAAEASQPRSVLGVWRLSPASGVATAALGSWWLRWDLSPLGYLATAAHGHLDALHLSLWREGVAVIVDPGTGAYYADEPVRRWLASRAAHNGPCPDVEAFPPRAGSFLWAGHHPQPQVVIDGEDVVGTLPLSGVTLRRRVASMTAAAGWDVTDECVGGDGRAAPFTVRWQFAPGTRVEPIADRVFAVRRAEASFIMDVHHGWTQVDLINPGSGGTQCAAVPGRISSLEGIVSPSFRRVCRAPLLKLIARSTGQAKGVFRTRFLHRA